MNIWFVCWMTTVIVQRLAELRLAKRHSDIIRSAGGYEVGADHYPRIVAVHAAFFIAMIAEYMVRSPVWSIWMALAAVAFILLQTVRFWCIRSLGTFWNTRIYVIPGMRPVRKGPYRYVRHPNYMVVTLEFLVLPLMFGCWLTALAFPILNMAVLRRRIAEEEQAVNTAASAQTQ